MVKVYVPSFVSGCSEVVSGVSLVFVVTYRNGDDCEYVGSLGSVRGLCRALRARLSLDFRFNDVQVFLPSGRLLCEVTRFGR